MLRELCVDAKLEDRADVYPVVASCRELRTWKLRWPHQANSAEIEGFTSVLQSCQRLEEVDAAGGGSRVPEQMLTSLLTSGTFVSVALNSLASFCQMPN